MKLTQGNLERLVHRWRPRLGLDGWDIAIEIAETEGEANHAECDSSLFYRRAQITVSPAADWRPGLEALVVHELLHVATRGIRIVGRGGLEDFVHPSTQGRHEDAFDRELEGEIDRLSVALVAAFRP